MLMTEFGELSVQFASLEHQVSELFAILADPSPMSFGGSLLADEFPLCRKIRLVRELARFRCAGDDRTAERIFNLCKQIDELRITRNEFAHGLWCFAPEKVNKGTISVMDMRWQSHKGEIRWSRGESKDYSVQDLRNLKKKTGHLFSQIVEVCAELRKMRLQPKTNPQDIAQNKASEAIGAPSAPQPQR